ncbi:MAG: pyridoxal-phosphate dependent enzyme [Candidatus Hodarchaeota archaeon]
MLWFSSIVNNYSELFSRIKSVDNFWDFYFTLPKIKKDFIVSLGEGGTPCKDSEKIGLTIGLPNLSFKNETQNPFTNSFKDRVAALLISHARSWDFEKVICASNGNQGASIAAYASLEGMKCINIIPSEIDIGKRAQIIMYNSELIIEGDTIDDALDFSLKSEYKDYYQCTPEFNPLTIEAQKTIAFEIFKQKGVPDWIIIPMGSGELLVSLWKGFSELKEANIIESTPKLVGVQSEISSPIIDEFFQKKKVPITKTEKFKPIALGIFVKKPLYKDLAINFIRKSNGTAISVPENLILSSIDDLITNEGIIAEPSSALTLSALYLLNQKGVLERDDVIVCLITGSGLKAPYVLEAISSRAKTAGTGAILSTKLKILSQISLSSNKGIYGSKIRDIIGSISLAAIYQHLKELEQKELISRKKEGKNVLYFITDKGKKVLEALDTLITLL